MPAHVLGTGENIHTVGMFLELGASRANVRSWFGHEKNIHTVCMFFVEGVTREIVGSLSSGRRSHARDIAASFSCADRVLVMSRRMIARGWAARGGRCFWPTGGKHTYCLYVF
jgi:hypothetical protein